MVIVYEIEAITKFKSRLDYNNNYNNQTLIVYYTPM